MRIYQKLLIVLISDFSVRVFLHTFFVVIQGDNFFESFTKTSEFERFNHFVLLMTLRYAKFEKCCIF